MANHFPPPSLSRRSFSAILGTPFLLHAASEPRPNILWITCEDIGPHLGAYGDTYADSPDLDKLAARGTIYRNAWSNAPVCAPARTTIISGLYPPSIGAEHMRSMTKLPDSMKMFPCYLRDAGYYTSNNVKEDYNIAKTGKVWDESSNKAHWRKRGAGQPFFSVFNFVITHESQIRTRPHTFVHDPAKARVPAYHPDTPEVRQDWAQYYDNITTMDKQAGEVLQQLESDGLVQDTVVVFFGDHGSGMPRSKRWPYNSGLQVPFIVYVPGKFKHLAPADYGQGKASTRLVSFVDLAPTTLSLAGVPLPPYYQGQAFLGKRIPSPRKYIHGFRGRMDERYDLVRSIRDERYIYIRNYMPHKIYGQHLAYMWETPTTRIWKKLFDEGKLNPVQQRFWQTKPPEELYDLQADRDEVDNLANSPKHGAVLKRLRAAQQEHALAIRDVGFLPEDEMHRRAANSSPYEVGHDDAQYPFKRVFAAAELASLGEKNAQAGLLRELQDKDSAVRYWGVLGFLIRGKEAVEAAAEPLRAALGDTAPSVRIAAAEALGTYGNAGDLEKALPVLLSLASPVKNGIYVAGQALNVIDQLGEKADPIRGEIAKLPKQSFDADPRTREYTIRLFESITAKRDSKV